METGVLSNLEIIQCMEKGTVIIDPFVSDSLSTSSYDVRLGKYYYREQAPSRTSSRFSAFPHIFNIYSKRHTERVWGDYLEAKPAGEVLSGSFINYWEQFQFGDGINRDDDVILLAPHETILAHTEEFIGGRFNKTTMMKARSSFGRDFIEICKCAGWGDIGYINRWTMEITNNSQHWHIPLVVGRRIAQIVFFYTGPLLDSNQQYEHKGSYQSDSLLEEVKSNWHPSMMLPRLHTDRDITRVQLSSHA